MFSINRSPTLAAVLRDLTSREAKARVSAAENAASALERDAQGGPAPRRSLIDALVIALRDSVADVRAAATLALADLRAHEALASVTIAAEDESPLVRQLAIAALGEIGDPRAKERVRRALGDPRAEIRFQAIVAYPRLVRGDDSGRAVAWSALRSALDDADDEVLARAAEACGELAEGGALPIEIAARLTAIAQENSASDEARVSAAITLGESRDAGGAAVLLDVIDGRRLNGDDVRVQTALELAGELNLSAAIGPARVAAFGLRARFRDPGRRAAALVALVRLGDAAAREAVLADLQSPSFPRRMSAIGVVSRAAMREARPALVAMRASAAAGDVEAIDDALAKLDSAGTVVESS